MRASEKFKITPTERRTAQLKARFADHSREWWPKQESAFKDREFNFHVQDGRFRLWSCVLSNHERQKRQDPLTGNLHYRHPS
jgi:hypothetical protein